MMKRLNRALREWRVRDVERELDEELDFHFERTVEELTARGLTEAQAREEARRRFGDMVRYRRELASVDRSAEARRRRLLWVAELVDDLRHALRRVRRSPGFAVAVMLIFALGIGANATMYGILDRILLSPPPHIAEPESVKRLFVDRDVSFMPERFVTEAVAYADYEDLRSVDGFSAVAAYSYQELVVNSGTEAERLTGLMVSGSYFGTLGTRPALGRLLGPRDDELGGQAVAVISQGLWRRRFGGDPRVLGRRMDFGTYEATIIGVAPRGFNGVDVRPVDVWQPVKTAAPRVFEEDDWRVSRGWYLFRVVARLASGISTAAAEAEATAVHRRARESVGGRGFYDPEARVVAASLIRARGPDAPAEATVARWLGGVALLLLIIVCANIANLLLARALRQRRESAVRLALGISRGRLLRQVTLESLILSLLGGGAALVVALAAGGPLRTALFPDVAWNDPTAPTRVLLFTAAAALLAGVLTGAVPALQALRPGTMDELRTATRGSTARRSATRNGLIVFQAALSVVLLVGAGLFVRSLDRVRSLDLGFEPEGVMVIEPTLDGALSDDERRAFFQRAEEALERVPGVTGATFAATAPFRGRQLGYSLRIPGVDSIPVLSTGGATLNAVEADYLDVLRQRLVRGRGLTAADDVEGATPVALVNETMARRIPWAGGDPIGQCMRLGSSQERPCVTIVGVVRDARRASVIEDETLQYYVTIGSGFVPMLPEALLVRGSVAPERLIDPLRRALHAGEPALRFARIRPLSELVDPDLRSWMLGAMMFSIFGGMALVVAAIGLYSVLAFAVTQRRQELGIRAALGADRRRLVVMVLRRALVLTGLGVAIGLLFAGLAAPWIRELLYDVSPRDPLVLAAVAGSLLVTAVVASVGPAARATRADPLAALRSE